MTDLILALDQGTTSSRSILFTEKAEIRAVASEPLECRYPDSGWVEQDAEAIWETQRSTIVKVLVVVGDAVEAGDPVCVLEAMKMENNVAADKAGTIAEVLVAPGDSVGGGDIVVVIE